MNSTVYNFLKDNRVSTLTTLLSDNMPHAAALHYSHIEDINNETHPFKLYFSVDSEQRKSQQLNQTGTSKAAVVIGFSEEQWLTLQCEGDVKIVKDKQEIKKIQKLHYAKHPNSEEFKDYPTTIFLEFTPTWWRYTDFNTDPLTIYSSETDQ